MAATANTRNWAAEYVAARVLAEQAQGITAQGKADAAARRIYNAADRAGVSLPAGLDDAARVQVHGLSAGERRNGITGYDATTGAPIFS